jgi:hypothetical protein
MLLLHIQKLGTELDCAKSIIIQVYQFLQLQEGKKIENLRLLDVLINKAR